MDTEDAELAKMFGQPRATTRPVGLIRWYLDHDPGGHCLRCWLEWRQDRFHWSC